MLGNKEMNFHLLTKSLLLFSRLTRSLDLPFCFYVSKPYLVLKFGLKCQLFYSESPLTPQERISLTFHPSTRLAGLVHSACVLNVATASGLQRSMELNHM